MLKAFLNCLTAENKKIIIKITHLEYEPKVLTPSQSQLGIIELIPATNQLGEVVQPPADQSSSRKARASALM